MKNSKLAGIALTLLFGVVTHGLSAVNAPRSTSGESLPTIDFVGAVPCTIGSAIGTTATLCGSGRSVVYGVIISSVASTDFMVFRDSATANVTSATSTIIFANGSNANATGWATQTFKFPVPMYFGNGISVNASVAPSGTASQWTILYRPLSATE